MAQNNNNDITSDAIIWAAKGAAKGAKALGSGAKKLGGAMMKEMEAETRLAEERQREKARKKEVRKAIIQEIKNFEFDESDEEAFKKSAVTFVSEYAECSRWPVADGVYKKAYKRRIEKELNILKTTDETHCAVLQKAYDEAKGRFKKFTIIQMCVFGVLTVGPLVGILIPLINADAIPVGASIGVAAFFGILIGCLFGLLPFAHIGHKKSDEE